MMTDSKSYIIRLHRTRNQPCLVRHVLWTGCLHVVAFEEAQQEEGLEECPESSPLDGRREGRAPRRRRQCTILQVYALEPVECIKKHSKLKETAVANFGR